MSIDWLPITGNWQLANGDLAANRGVTSAVVIMVSRPHRTDSPLIATTQRLAWE